MDSEINITKSMTGKKIIYKRAYLDNHYHGGYFSNQSEAEKVQKKIVSDMTINSNFTNPYMNVTATPVKVKLIK